MFHHRTEKIDLPVFEKTGGMPLIDTLWSRRSTKRYVSNNVMTEILLSQILWAAAGINRDGKRTYPSARGRYPVDLLVAMESGVYQYNQMDHALIMISDKDIRGIIPKQDQYKSVGVILLYVVDRQRATEIGMQWVDFEIGAMGQNVYLQAENLGLGSCIFASINREDTIGEIGIDENHKVLRIAQVVG